MSVSRHRVKNPTGAYNLVGNTEKPRVPPRVERCGWFNCTNVLLFAIFAMVLSMGLVALVGGVKTKPTAMEMMARFVGISETVKMGRSLMESDQVTQLLTEAQRLYRMVPQETVQEALNKAAVIIHSLSEEELVQTKTNIVKFADMLGSIEKEKVQSLISSLDVNKINELIESTSAVEQRLKDLHEIKIQI